VDALLLAPIGIPLATAVLCLFAWGRPRIQRVVSVAGSIGLFFAALALFGAVSGGSVRATQVGAWRAPFGITFVADVLSGLMVLLAAGMGLAVLVFALGTLDTVRERSGFHALYHFLLMGVSGAFLTGDLFNLYVWFEVLLISSFVMMVLGGDRAQLDGGIKYVTLNLMSSMLFLVSVGVLYGAAGTLNMADLSVALRSHPQPGLVLTLATMFLVAFGIKAAAFPVFAWLPASYHTPPPAVAALFAGLLTKVGVYALIRVFTLVFVVEAGAMRSLIQWIAGLTMVVGVLGAASQGTLRRILSFHIVSQIGYMLMGLGIGTRTALAGTVFYIAHHIVVKTDLFLIAGIVERLGGSGELRRTGGLARRWPLLAGAFLLAALALAGIPPLSGFWAKLLLVLGGLEAGDYALVATSLAVSLLTLFSMTKIWNEVFWKRAPEDSPPPALPSRSSRPMLAPVLALTLVSIAIGLLAGPVFGLASRAAAQLLDPGAYVEAVLGAGRR